MNVGHVIEERTTPLWVRHINYAGDGQDVCTGGIKIEA